MVRPNSSHTGKRRRNRKRLERSAPPVLAVNLSKELEEICRYKFKDKALLARAMTHTSAVPGDASKHSNERLEFLGDRVLGLVIANQLLLRFESEREGGLAPRLNALVSRETCARVAEQLSLGQFLILDPSEQARGGAHKPSLLADVTEAIIGAIYLDGGLSPAEKFITRHWKAFFMDLEEAPKDAKSALQEVVQANGKPTPVYTLKDRVGPDHAPVFTVEVSVDGIESQSGQGASKQDAERQAARAMLEVIGEDI